MNGVLLLFRGVGNFRFIEFFLSVVFGVILELFFFRLVGGSGWSRFFFYFSILGFSFRCGDYFFRVVGV